MTFREKIAAAIRSPQSRDVDEAVALVDEIRQRGELSTTFCQDCGSRRIVTRFPDGGTAYMPGHPDYTPEGAEPTP